MKTNMKQSGIDMPIQFITGFYSFSNNQFFIHDLRLEVKPVKDLSLPDDYYLRVYVTDDIFYDFNLFKVRNNQYIFFHNNEISMIDDNFLFSLTFIGDFKASVSFDLFTLSDISNLSYSQPKGNLNLSSVYKSSGEKISAVGAEYD
jgi:hypothetical protein